MNCRHARKLYAAFWDDETTQVEREWLEAHFASCAECRREYEQYARTLETLGSLPRVEAAPDLVDRVLQRVRRAETVPDRLPAGRPLWVPVASGIAAVALMTLTLLGPWLGVARSPQMASRDAGSVAVSQPVRVTPPLDANGVASGRHGATVSLSVSDSLFDHTEDVEFILDPVTLHRGRAAVHRTAYGTPEEKAVITF